MNAIDHMAGAPAGGLREVQERVKSLLPRLEVYGQSGVLLALRLIYGGLFVQTGWGKLTHLERTTAYFDSLHLPLPGLNAAMAGGTELLGGALLVLGLGSRFAALALTGVMAVAYLTAHSPEAFESLEKFMDQLPWGYLVASLVVLVFGPGRLAVDRFLFKREAPTAG